LCFVCFLSCFLFLVHCAMAVVVFGVATVATTAAIIFRLLSALLAQATFTLIESLLKECTGGQC
jgi:hypothetical protein